MEIKTLTSDEVKLLVYAAACGSGSLSPVERDALADIIQRLREVLP